MKINVATKTATVTHLAVVQPDSMCHVLNDHMLAARVLTVGGYGSSQQAEPYSLRRFFADLADANSVPSRFLLTVQAVLFMVGMIMQEAGLGERDLPMSLFTVVILFSHTLVQRTVLSLVRRCITIHLLMGMVFAGAIILHQFREAATVALVVGGSEWLVSRINVVVEATLQKNLSSGVTYATALKPNGSMEQIPIDKLKPGNVVLVRSGDVIPIDGKVQKSSSGFKVDEACVTGEALPLEKAIGDTVLSGTVVVAGMGEIECTALAKDSFQGRMQQAVEEARSTRSPTEDLVNHLASWYTPLVVLGAICVACWTGKIERGLTALVGACPCALMAAAPMVQACVFVSMLRDLQVLVKNAHALETLGQMSTLGVDKTGTLTEGHFNVADAALMPGANGRLQHELFQLLCALESRDPHPLASSIIRAHIGCASEFATASAGALPRVDNFTRVESMGVWGVVGGDVVGAGSLDFLDAMSIEVPDEAAAVLRTWEGSGGAFTAVYMIIESDVVMMLRLEDTVRSDARAAMQLLSSEGVEVSMLTGDNKLPAQAVAAQVGITDFSFGMRPLGKQAWVHDRRFKREGPGRPAKVAQSEVAALEAGLPQQKMKRARCLSGAVGMFGDGLNDGPAMAAADVGIALSCGLQLTVDAADVVVSNGGRPLVRLAAAVAMAKRSRRLILQNVLLAIVTEAVVLKLAASGQLSLSLGIFTDTGSLLLVLFNSLRPLAWRDATRRRNRRRRRC